MKERLYGPAYQEQKEDPTRCIESVSGANGWHFYQCMKKRGKGEDGLYCGTHAARNERAKRCYGCEDTGHREIKIPTTFHCGVCKKKCTDPKCKAKKAV